jgi:hypothetical protein
MSFFSISGGHSQGDLDFELRAQHTGGRRGVGGVHTCVHTQHHSGVGEVQGYILRALPGLVLILQHTYSSYMYMYVHYSTLLLLEYAYMYINSKQSSSTFTFP